jgi:hypothetical protein
MNSKTLVLIVIVASAGPLITIHRDLQAMPKHAADAGNVREVSIRQALNAHTMAFGTGVSGSIKLCSAVQHTNWRDTILAPEGWAAQSCRAFAASIGTSSYQLGCADDKSFSWGAIDGGPPPADSCGWR